MNRREQIQRAHTVIAWLVKVARRRLADIRDRLAQGKAPMGEQPEREES